MEFMRIISYYKVSLLFFVLKHFKDILVSITDLPNCGPDIYIYIRVTRHKMGVFSCENFQRTLQGWICLIGVMALGNTISCFVSPSFISERLYTGAPEKANDLAARLFGMWTLVAALLRIFCAFCIENRCNYI